MSDPKKHWWETVPGILSGIAAIIAAIGGFVAILNQPYGDAKEAVIKSVPVAPNETPAAAVPAASKNAAAAEGRQEPAVVRKPMVERRPMAWDYIVNSSKDHETKCRNQFGELVGDWRSCHSDGTCKNGSAIVAMCRTLYGSEYVLVDGVRVRDQ